MIALISLHDEKYKPLAELTWHQNKIPYAHLHNYKTFCSTEILDSTVSIGYQKIVLLRNLMKENPDVEWFWWTGCDTLITNWKTKVEEKIDPEYHFIIASDCNGLNADSFLVRNTRQGQDIIEYVWSLRDEVKDDPWQEQRAIIKSVPVFKDMIKIVPQKELNAYNTAIYNNQSNLDTLGTDGTWRPGDFLIHWPGLSLERRIWLACFYRNYIVK